MSPVDFCRAEICDREARFSFIAHDDLQHTSIGQRNQMQKIPGPSSRIFQQRPDSIDKSRHLFASRRTSLGRDVGQQTFEVHRHLCGGMRDCAVNQIRRWDFSPTFRGSCEYRCAGGVADDDVVVPGVGIAPLIGRPWRFNFCPASFLHKFDDCFARERTNQHRRRPPRFLANPRLVSPMHIHRFFAQEMF